MVFCREWLNMLMGPLRRYPLRIGMIDLTPIVMIIAIQIVHQVCSYILLKSYLGLM